MDRKTVRIEKMVSGANGLAKIDGITVFVPYSLPGELLEVELYNKKKSFSFAKIIEIKEASPERIKPLCPLFGKCGGCQLQMLEYKNQLKYKQAIIEESIRRIGKMEIKVNDPVASDNEFFYRNKGSFQVFGEQKIGYCIPGTTRPFSIESCPIMEKGINDKLKTFIEDPEENLKLKGMKALVIRSNIKGKIINSTISRDNFMEEVAGLSFFVDVDTFFQVNRSIIPKWLAYIKKIVASRNVGKGLLDLYCGVGIISQYLASDFDQVFGIEINKRLVQNGNQVLKRNKIKNAKFVVADASRFDRYGFDYDTVIINPPRKGINYRMVKTLLEASPEVIIYSSCNPDTFARDIAQLSENGYSIDEIQPFDMFPQTQHSEVVGVLYKNK